jgi:hypothetical protein
MGSLGSRCPGGVELVRRGEIHLVNLDPHKSGDANKSLIAVIRNDGANVMAGGTGQGVPPVERVTPSLFTVESVQFSSVADRSKPLADPVRISLEELPLPSLSFSLDSRLFQSQ